MDLISIENLKAYFFQGKGILSKLFGQGSKTVHAVDGVTLSIKKGRTFGLVGESGCGKSTLAKAIFGLVACQEGRICFEGDDILTAPTRVIKSFRQRAQLIFQDPYASLNPRMTAGQIIAEPLHLYKSGKMAVGRRVTELLESVGLPGDAVFKFPIEFSGGQARRIGVARAIALNPDFIVADEPTSGLDISTAATILNLMQDLQEKLNLTYLWISHNLNQVKYMSDDIAIMYLGKVVEMGKTSDVLSHLAHPYSRALISVIPQLRNIKKKDKIILEGEIPSPITPPSGCRFRTRCKHASKKCKAIEPSLIDLGAGHYASCHLLG
jgi:oligopeptide/dipeptide ABC transporter ATP-binding protein